MLQKGWAVKPPDHSRLNKAKAESRNWEIRRRTADHISRLFEIFPIREIRGIRGWIPFVAVGRTGVLNRRERREQRSERRISVSKGESLFPLVQKSAFLSALSKRHKGVASSGGVSV